MSETPHNPCATCGRCCRSYVVPVCGHDIWQICRAQRLSPASFLLAAPQPEPDPEGFRLERDGPTFYVVLDKQGRFTIKQRCVFLVTLGGGHERCGIYDHRPIVCRTYPMNLMASVVSPRPDLLCPPDSWPDEVIRRPAWRATLDPSADALRSLLDRRRPLERPRRHRADRTTPSTCPSTPAIC